MVGKNSRFVRRIMLAFWLVFLVSCSPVDATEAGTTPRAPVQPTSLPTQIAPRPTLTPVPATQGPPTPTRTQFSIEIPTATITPTSTPTPEIFPFARPIGPQNNDLVDPTYRFSTTQDGAREPHHGVEFLNSSGTEVYAAREGRVVFAGDDNNGGPYSPKGWFAFYGQFIVLEHEIPGYSEPFYTLYAHLSEILVEAGQEVETGNLIGRVGFTGAAEGSHLHFEIRYGGSGYEDSRNPEIWMLPQTGRGSLVGQISDEDGFPIPVTALQISLIDGTGPQYYFSTYEDPLTSFMFPYEENFSIGNLPAGAYELSFIIYRLDTVTFEILPGELTFLEIIVSAEN